MLTMTAWACHSKHLLFAGWFKCCFFLLFFWRPNLLNTLKQRRLQQSIRRWLMRIGPCVTKSLHFVPCKGFWSMRTLADKESGMTVGFKAVLAYIARRCMGLLTVTKRAWTNQPQQAQMLMLNSGTKQLLVLWFIADVSCYWSWWQTLSVL